ncbi:MAG: protein kinase [Proteobacteria bacterium]|nr:protein kinase [Pseudomonadota bacterium]
MASIYVARHLETGQEAALKVLHGIHKADSDAVERFRREARITTDIGHPGIVKIFEADRDEQDGALFIAMELLRGETFGQWVKRAKPTAEAVLAKLQRVLEPLAAAHARGCVHRDLKPDNVFISRPDSPEERVKLLDFGIARDAAEVRLTQTGASIGTPHYMSPEHARTPRGLTAAADIWSLGVMMYEAIAGGPPFDGESLPDIVVKSCTKPHVSLVDLIPDLEPEIAQLVDRCLAKKPGERPQDASELREQVQRVLALPPRYPGLQPDDLPAVRRSQLPSGRPSMRESSERLPGRSSRASRRSSLPAPRLSRPSSGTARQSLPGVQGRSATEASLVPALMGTLIVLGGVAVAFSASSTNLSLAQLLAGSLCVVGLGLTSLGAIRTRRSSRRNERAGHAAGAETPVSRYGAASVPPRHGERSPPAFGPADAPVTIVEVSDLASAQARNAHAELRRALLHWGDYVRVQWKNHPRFDDRLSWQAAEAAHEVHAQCGEDGFWKFHALMLRQQPSLSTEVIERCAAAAGADVEALGAQLARRAHRAPVQRERDNNRISGGFGVPLFVVNGRMLQGDANVASLCEAIEDALEGDPEAVERGQGRGQPGAPSREEPAPRATPLHSDSQEMMLRAITVYCGDGGGRWPGRTRQEAQMRASAIHRRVNAGGCDFGSAARTMSDDPQAAASGGDLGRTRPSRLPAELREQARALDVGAISPIVESDKGFHILQRYG